jgi:hypothetical protein
MKKIFQFLKKLFARTKFYVQQYVRPSIHVVEALKMFMDSPAVPIITALIPGYVDDIIAARIAKVLPEVLKVLGYADECSKAQTNDALVQCVIAKIRLFPDARKDAAFHNIAVLLSQYLSDGKLSWAEAIHLAEMSYSELKGKI